MTDELKLAPCPFCGGQDLKRVKFSSVRHFINCTDCMADGPIKRTPEAAIEAWNVRNGTAKEQA